MTDRLTDKLLNIATTFEKSAKKKKDVHGNFVFSKTHPKVKDKKDHFPINHARNALARAGAFTSAPKWFKGTLTEFQNAIRRKVKSDYPGIEIAKKKKDALDTALEYNLVKNAIQYHGFDDEPILPEIYREELEPSLSIKEEMEDEPEPEKEMCPVCDGSGYDLSGLTDEELDRLDAFGNDYPKCEMCNGKGTVPAEQDINNAVGELSETVGSEPKNINILRALKDIATDCVEMVFEGGDHATKTDDVTLEVYNAVVEAYNLGLKDSKKSK